MACNQGLLATRDVNARRVAVRSIAWLGARYERFPSPTDHTIYPAHKTSADDRPGPILS